jgi:hypothetical protein
MYFPEKSLVSNTLIITDLQCIENQGQNETRRAQTPRDPQSPKKESAHADSRRNGISQRRHGTRGDPERVSGTFNVDKYCAAR